MWNAVFVSLALYIAEVPDSPIPVTLEMPRFTSPGHLDPTIYPTEVGVSSVGGRETDVQMLSTAIQITLDLERNVKVCFISSSCRLSVGLIMGWLLFVCHIQVFINFFCRSFWSHCDSMVLLYDITWRQPIIAGMSRYLLVTRLEMCGSVMYNWQCGFCMYFCISI